MRKMTRQFLGLVLAMVMVISQFASAGVVSASEQSGEGSWVATQYFTNGDFEDADEDGFSASEWSVNFSTWENATYATKTESRTNNTTRFLNIWNGTGAPLAVIMSRTLEDIPAGTYRVSFQQDGEKMSSGLSVSVAGAPVELPATTGWDVWSTVTTEAFVLTDVSDVTVTISGDVSAGYWGDFDNFVLEQYVVLEEEEPEVEKPEQPSETEEGYVVVLNTDKAEVKAGETVSLTAKVTKNGETVTDLKADGLYLWWWTDTWNSHSDGNGDAVYSNYDNNSGYSLTADVTLPSVGTYYIVAELKDATDTKILAETITFDVTDPNSFVASDNNYTVVVTVDNLAPETGDTVAMTAKVTKADGTDVTDLEEAGLKLWWWSDKWMTGHEDGLMDAEYTKDAEGYALTASVKLPSVGTHYIIGELEYNGTKLPVVIPMTTTEPEVDTSVSGEISVEKIKNLPEDFIMGMDISSVMSQFASGVTYKDFEGNTINNITDFCKVLASNGITHIRVRVWNDPFDANGNGYGGGNSDVETAAAIAEGCRAAGLKMLIDFHCSDLWADPGKQQAPKAWAGYSVAEKATAVEEFIGSALQTIDPNHETVDMVQVGNETTGAFVGVSNVADMCTLFSAGAKAVREYNDNVKVVIHVTNPEKGNVTSWGKKLNDNAVDYDVLATSYYPYWHGTLANLESELKSVKDTYGKDVMVAETSYAYTLEDSDGHSNTVRVGNNDSSTSYPFSVQGQAASVRDVMATVNNAGGLGVFYWESAWITVGDTRGLSGAALDAQIAANQEKWEAFGSGWASSYAAEYDAEDAGKWYGGSAVDNEAMFYPDGTPTAALYVWNYVKTGAVSKYTSVEEIVNPEENIESNGTYTLPETVAVTYNKGDVEESVVWNTEDVEKINTTIPGTYKVNGTVTFSTEVNSGAYVGQTTASVVYTLIVKQPNLITDAASAGFENGADYTIGGNGISAIPAKDDPYSGVGSMHWYNTSATTGAATYNKALTLEPAKYCVEIKTQGYAGDTVTLQVLGTADEVLFEGKPVTLEGWAVWKTAEVRFDLLENTNVKIRISVAMQDGGWGTADELYLYKVGELDAKHATVVEKVEDEEGNESFVLTNEKVEGVVISGTTEILETAKFEAVILNEESEEFATVLEKVIEVGTVDVKEDTKVAVVAVDLWAVDGAEIHEDFGTVTVAIDMPETLAGAKEVEVYRVEDGELFVCDAEVVDGKIVFTTDHFSTFLIKEKDVQSENNTSGSNTENNGENSSNAGTTVGNTANSIPNITTSVEETKIQNTVSSFGINVSEVVESMEEKVEAEIVEEVEAEEKVEESFEENSEITILDEEVPLAVNAGGDILMWPIFLATFVFLAFVGVYVVAKQRKMIK